MKIATILGTRPEIIRLSLVIPALDRICDHVLIHTGQNFDERLSEIFFRELDVRSPDHFLGIQADRFGAQAGQILDRVEQILLSTRQDRVLILGDTNSALSAVVARRMGVPVFHMEAGNRCWDDRVPEEVNRRLVDHCSDILMPYTERSRDNLLHEGFSARRIFVTGNPIAGVMETHRDAIASSTILSDLELTAGKYFLLTLHRAENVDVPSRLNALMQGISRLVRIYDCPVIISAHPRFRQRIEAIGIALDPHLRLLPPFGFFDFGRLERDAFCVLTDSGTVQEECAILRVPNVTLRDVTERPETLECGAGILAGTDPDTLERAVRVSLDRAGQWSAPAEYLRTNVSDTVLKLVTGHHEGLPGGLAT
jgi:UDP-N-acetylglucosamine 2-epimerase (non-hydrolysing)